jgi:rod shape-determining protein MreD
VQIDLIPVLMVYCGLTGGVGIVGLTAVCGGLWLDALSANPLGVSVLPYFAVGLAVYQTRDLVLKDQPYARSVLGMAACATAPLLTVLLLWGAGYKPLIGWGSLWQWLVLALAGAVLTPVCFWFFQRMEAALAYKRPPEPYYRADREIKRGRD